MWGCLIITYKVKHSRFRYDGRYDVPVRSTRLIVPIFPFFQVSFEVEIPEQVIILDPRVSEKDETYARIVQVGIVYRGCMSLGIYEFVSVLFTFIVQVG